MKLNEKQFGVGISVITNDTNRMIMLSMYKNNALSYGEITKSIVDYKNWKTSTKTSKSNYYIRKLHTRKIIRKDDTTKYYYLTRFGLQLCELIDDLESVCMEYDMDDVDADGRVMVTVKR